VSAREETGPVKKKGQCFTSTVSILGCRSYYSADIQRNMTQYKRYFLPTEERTTKKNMKLFKQTFLKRKNTLIKIKKSIQ
jgi:hypothetical protein